MILRLPRLSALALLLLTAATAQAQTQKVANYSYGQPGTAKYEHFSFWTQDGQRAELSYTYGKDRKEAKLTYLGLDKVNGKPAFKVQFPNKHILYIIPTGTTLRVTDNKLAAQKTYRWEYEGPVNGVGTFCQPCAEDEKKAMQLVQSAYLK
jgi:hypothetical protein